MKIRHSESKKEFFIDKRKNKENFYDFIIIGHFSILYREHTSQNHSEHLFGVGNMIFEISQKSQKNASGNMSD